MAHRRRKPLHALPSVEKKPFGPTILFLRFILHDIYTDSQAEMAARSKLNISLLYRTLQGERSPTPTVIGRVMGGLRRPCKDEALKLIEIFLQDIANQTRKNHVVTVEAIT